jgi:hypothetical protein
VFKAGSEQEKEFAVFHLQQRNYQVSSPIAGLLAKDRENSVASLRLSPTPIRFGMTVQTGVENMNGN